MSGEIQTYVLAVRRDLRTMVPADWQSRLREIPGVLAGEAATPNRIQIEADEEALAMIQAEFGASLHIEKLSPRALTD